ncbi:MAG TPA: metal ABC transporter ATP-binding protein [Firmicutes bacterium]|nr:metal ABC transporter ATP-binding protein [Bacillota bacterium]
MSRHHTSGTCRTTISKLGVKLGKNTILRDINFILNCGELTALIGPNGAGKTTLLKALLGEYPHTGTVTFHTPEGKLRKLRIGYVPQKINTEQNSPVTVYDLFAAFLSSRPVFFGKKQDLARTIAAQLALFDVAQHLDSRLCDLSGGELQRVMLALAVYPVPELLILDEPAAGIDRNGLVVLYRQLAKLKKEQDITILLVSHDLPLVREHADQVILLDKTILARGTAEEVLSSRAFRDTFTYFAQSGVR